MNQEKIGKNIANLRKRKGLTQEKLGEKLQVTAKTVSKWETGRALPDVLLMNDLAKELDTTISELLSEESISERKKNTKRKRKHIIY